MSICVGCSKPCGEPPLKCPTCLKYNVTATFCGQDCFKSSWGDHKSVHKATKARFAAQLQSKPLTMDDIQSMEDQMANSNFDANGPPVNTYEPPMDRRKEMPRWGLQYTFSGALRPALQSATRTVPSHIKKPDYAGHPDGASACENEEKKGNDIKEYKYGSSEFEDLKYACQMGREVLDAGGKACRVGVTTDEIDRVVHEAAIERDCYPSPLNYYNFPKSVCTSINEIICHGIPDYREIVDGDICNIDVTTYVKNFHGDLNETYMCGKVDERGQKLVKTAFDCLAIALDKCKPGTLYQDLGKFIQRTAEKSRCTVVKTYCGHGIGTEFHCRPNVPHYKNNRARGVMKEGHVFTVEPMINEGSYEDMTWGDNWSASTADGKRSAQFEHTVIVTKDGCEILTARENEPKMLWDASKNTR